MEKKRKYMGIFRATNALLDPEILQDGMKPLRIVAGHIVQRKEIFNITKARIYPTLKLKAFD